MKSLGFTAVLALLVTGCGNLVSAPIIPVQGNGSHASVVAASGLSTQENEFLKLINALRSESGLHPLSIDASLQAAASHHSAYMLASQNLSHSEPAPNVSSGDRIANEGGEFNATGENIAVGTGEASSTFDAWYGSSGHRENMLSDQYQYIGISQKGSYWTTDFAGN